MLDQAVTRCNHNYEALDELRKLTQPVITDDTGLFAYTPLMVGDRKTVSSGRDRRFVGTAVVTGVVSLALIIATYALTEAYKKERGR